MSTRTHWFVIRLVPPGARTAPASTPTAYWSARDRGWTNDLASRSLYEHAIIPSYWQDDDPEPLPIGGQWWRVIQSPHLALPIPGVPVPSLRPHQRWTRWNPEHPDYDPMHPRNHRRMAKLFAQWRIAADSFAKEESK